MIGKLPKSIVIGGEKHKLRSDYRNVLQVFEAFNDPDLGQEEKWIVAIYLLLKPFACAEDVYAAIESGFDVQEAMQRIMRFISAGQPDKEIVELPVYSWSQDEQMIFSAVNKVAGRETRELDCLHWWTFLGYFKEIGEGDFSFIVGIRNKLNKRRKLEKHEKEFLSRNKGLVLMKKPKTKEEQEQEDKYNALLDEVLG